MVLDADTCIINDGLQGDIQLALRDQEEIFGIRILGGVQEQKLAIFRGQ
jgi:hypothetical protein